MPLLFFSSSSTLSESFSGDNQTLSLETTFPTSCVYHGTSIVKETTFFSCRQNKLHPSFPHQLTLISLLLSYSSLCVLAETA